MNHTVKVIVYCLMFSKSGILIFIFAENNYLVRQYIYAHTMLIKTPLLHQSFGPHVFLSFFLSFSLLLSYSRLRTTRFPSVKEPTAYPPKQFSLYNNMEALWLSSWESRFGNQTAWPQILALSLTAWPRGKKLSSQCPGIRSVQCR